ncbi:MAG: hypothetical protein M0P64_04310 [Candidatus Pacebacteria bacterium]|jgi:hypothetical protein|nr:hypothetical protein [Candidatus Paceibacterota bacterium]
MEKFKKILKYLFAALGVLFVLYFFVLVYVGYNRYDDAKVAEQVQIIQDTHITLDDVMGKYLPADPGAEADKTIAGVDTNNNGIRDDVELAIFKEYPNSAKTRAVLLQYALALQMETMQPFLDEKNVVAVVIKENRADACVSDTLVPRETPESWRTSEDVQKIEKYVSFVEDKQFDTLERKKTRDDFFKKSGSYEVLRENVCDVNTAVLVN